MAAPKIANGRNFEGPARVCGYPLQGDLRRIWEPPTQTLDPTGGASRRSVKCTVNRVSPGGSARQRRTYPSRNCFAQTTGTTHEYLGHCSATSETRTRAFTRSLRVRNRRTLHQRLTINHSLSRTHDPKLDPAGTEYGGPSPRHLTLQPAIGYAPFRRTGSALFRTQLAIGPLRALFESRRKRIGTLRRAGSPFRHDKHGSAAEVGATGLPQTG